jgi:hypothetical protein
MITRLIVVSIAAASMAAGCASINTRWDACEKNAGTFVQLADCTLEAVQADARETSTPTLRMRSETRAKAYAQKAEELMEKVGTGRMPDPEARVLLRRALDELMDQERDERLSPLRPPQRTGVTCSPSGNTVSCTAN